MNSSPKKKLLVMAGKPIASVDIVTYARSKGIYTIVTDNLITEDSPAKLLADEAWSISTNDVEIIVNKAREEKIDAVFTGVHEFNIKKTLEVCAQLNLPFYATEKQLTVTSVKSLYKDLFRKFDIPVVPEYVVEELDPENIPEMQFPVVLKPVDNCGGYGISICKDKNDLLTNYPRALSFSGSKKVLIERHISAKEVTIFYIIQDGSIYLSAMADRHMRDVSEGVIPLPVAYLFPSVHLNTYLKDLNVKVIKCFESIGLKNGMLFIQSFIGENGFYFYDIGFRLTGTQEYHIIEKLCSYNPLKMMVDFSLTAKMGDVDIQSLVDPFFHGKVACNITYLCKPCVIGKIEGVEKIKCIPGVIAVVLNHAVGGRIPDSAIGTLNQIIVRVFATANDKETLVKIIEQSHKLLAVYDSNNEYVLLPSISVDKIL